MALFIKNLDHVQLYNGKIVTHIKHVQFLLPIKKYKSQPIDKHNTVTRK